MSATSIDSRTPYQSRPFAWLIAALALLGTALIAAMVASGAAWDELHPAINAMLNGSSTVLLFAGFVAIKKGNTELHWRCMLAAFAASSVFLASYLVRFYLSGTHRYPGTGADKVAYLIILFSHMLLAIVAVPMILRLLWLARKKEFDKHRKLARWTWPIWMYVSLTGVIVYLMLYPVADALYGP